MSPSADLLKAVDGLGSTNWAGVAFRHVAPNRDPLQGFGSFLAGGRWNPRDSFSTIYLASPVEACIAEFLRMASGQGRGAESFLPRTVYEIRVEELELLDLRASDARASLDLDEEDISSADRTKCQEVGATAHFLGFQGVLAPSATGMGVVLAVFESRVRKGDLVVVDEHPLSAML